MNVSLVSKAFRSVQTPDDVLTVLEMLSEVCGDEDQASTEAWGEVMAGAPWSILQYFVDRAAAEANVKLLRDTAWGWKESVR